MNEKKKPNILFIMTDQHRYEALGCHGATLLKTPNIDRLAAGGVDFQRTYSQSAICMPSRVSFFTGQYLHTHGIMHNSKHADVSGLTTLPRLLKEAHGYQTAVVGKTHTGPCEQMGFDFTRLCAGESEGERNDYNEYLKGLGLIDRGWYSDAHLKDYDTYVSHIPYRHSVEAWTGDESIAWLKKTDREKPFFLWTSFERPHVPNCVPKDNPFPYNPADIELPPYDEKWYNKPDVRRPGCESTWNVFQTGEGRLRDAIANYYSLISMIDDQVGRIIRQLEEMNELENTIIVFTADHGEFCGEYGQFGKNLSTFDVLYRIPCIVSWKGKTAKEQIHELTESVDLMPTLLDLCGLECPHTVQGRSLVDAVLASGSRRGMPWDANDAVFFETPFIKTVRTKTHKLSLCWKEKVSWGQLYNLEADPTELDNRYDDPQYSHIRETLTTRLLRWLIQTEQPQVHGAGLDETVPPWRWYEATKYK